MNDLASLFLENIFPVIAVAAFGFALQRRLSLDPRPISITIFNVLTPALIFELTIQNPASNLDSLKMVGVALSLSILLTLLSLLIARLLRLPRKLTSAFILVVVFMNAGNYGLSVNQFALGSDGLYWASLFFITNVVLMNSLGVYYANRGEMTAMDSLRDLLKVPALYAFILALVVRISGISLGTVVLKPISLMASATIPAMILVLGMQIARAGLPERIGLVSVVALIRLVLSPALAWLLTAALDLPLIGAQAAIIEAAMPSPVLAIIISLEFDTEPGFVSSAVLLTTLLSPLTLTPVLALLRI